MWDDHRKGIENYRHQPIEPEPEQESGTTAASACTSSCAAAAAYPMASSRQRRSAAPAAPALAPPTTPRNLYFTYFRYLAALVLIVASCVNLSTSVPSRQRGRGAQAATVSRPTPCTRLSTGRRLQMYTCNIIICTPQGGAKVGAATKVFI
ncbi:hypothetical protein PG994_012456 [Apiospora phragmitis]|uniref:Uncharacterized protein n=1 Tax=Apiospora phragmitis TaxID=2905665 RepID=A0ABR1TVN8_9PEZI